MRSTKVVTEQLAEDAAYDYSLRELRRARQLTQVQLANVLGTTQPTVIEIERRSDLYLSTLRSYVEAMGGRLLITAEFDDGVVPMDGPRFLGTIHRQHRKPRHL